VGEGREGSRRRLTRVRGSLLIESLSMERDPSSGASRHLLPQGKKGRAASSRSRGMLRRCRRSLRGSKCSAPHCHANARLYHSGASRSDELWRPIARLRIHSSANPGARWSLSCAIARHSSRYTRRDDGEEGTRLLSSKPRSRKSTRGNAS